LASNYPYRKQHSPIKDKCEADGWSVRPVLAKPEELADLNEFRTALASMTGAAATFQKHAPHPIKKAKATLEKQMRGVHHSSGGHWYLGTPYARRVWLLILKISFLPRRL